MGKYIINRLAYGLLVLFGVVTTIFFLFNVLPGDPAAMMLGERSNSEAVAVVNKDLGLDRPIAEQYLNYINDLSPLSVHQFTERNFWYLDPAKYSWISLAQLGSRHVLVFKYPYLRRSYISRREVSDIIRATLPETAVLAFAAMFLASVFGIGLGIVCALKKNTLTDRVLFLLATVVGMSAPSFLIGLVIAWLFGYVLSAQTGLTPSGSLFDFDVWEGEKLQLRNLILPAITLGIRPLSIIMQLTRSSLLDVLSQDYIRTAKAKGLSQSRIILRHALRNALNPVITAISGWFAGLLAGAVFVEKIFSWKGIGNEVVDALNNNDLPVVMGATLVFACIFVLINLGVDILYGVLDPRVRIK